ncbi:hypothetical protein ACE1CI_28385 [Aerosakkonemataceae cyanobacterium BLCC-F50]|uniref:Uncharacterized protein n=1 Tax=Floridaenema flaviceps BLCC-F50 TaxID=3153642 RepID=A0ABV4XYP0_9CYAN
MLSKGKFPLLIVLFLLFVLLGDRIPFPPVSNASLQTRTTINNFMLGLFPKKQPKNPYERTERAIEKQEQGGQ